ncbi:protein ALP1-like isoform X2 [Spinacia oleracea]|uniref:Protein ALP1-like isoform X2 n=1 Tax=Spinacia oleracea TaxID=3562 RepID=A0A9R0KCF6_SPIOL|nr:protein ALP1-like isoform X2 [Spinacia oleracea]XP_056692428.1 protein ALP1-like isoform X2 [Spinacia oleracea]
MCTRIFKEVLDAMDGLSRDILRPRDPEFKEIPSQIVDDTRYMPHFKRINCDIEEGKEHLHFDLLFTYVLTGWEGSAHDSRIFLDTIGNPSLNFPKLPPGKYYLVDKGYPEREGYLTPYHKKRYHQTEFHGAIPRGPREIFNRAHSSLRSCIERSFGILKARWEILRTMPKYSLQDQNRIVCACFALHNYIRLSKVPDPGFKIIDEDPTFIPPEVSMDVECGSTQEVQRVSTNEMTKVREEITTSLMRSRRRRRRRSS